MNISVNGEILQTKASTLEHLLSELGYEGEWLATALNSALVPTDARSTCKIKEGDRIEVLSPMQGG